MLDRMRSDEGGFTLIELLVVILIIGILAAIALPSFLGQQTKGQDSSAKSDARNLVSQIESCFADTQDYSQCQNTNLTDTGLNVSATDGATPAVGEVSVTAAGTAPTNTYTIEAMSKSGNSFSIIKGSTGTLSHTCTVASGGNKGGCKDATSTTAGW